MYRDRIYQVISRTIAPKGHPAISPQLGYGQPAGHAERGSNLGQANRGGNRGPVLRYVCAIERPRGVLPKTVTGVPTSTALKNAIAVSSGKRTQPCEAG